MIYRLQRLLHGVWVIPNSFIFEPEASGRTIGSLGWEDDPGCSARHCSSSKLVVIGTIVMVLRRNGYDWHLTSAVQHNPLKKQISTSRHLGSADRNEKFNMRQPHFRGLLETFKESSMFQQHSLLYFRLSLVPSFLVSVRLA